MKLVDLMKIRRRLGGGPWPVTEVVYAGKLAYEVNAPGESIFVRNIDLAKFISMSEAYVSNEISLTKQSVR